MRVLADRAAGRATRKLLDFAALLCVAQLVVGTLALPFLFATQAGLPWPRRGLLFLHAVVYGCVGVLLRYVSHAEERARTLGLFLLCTGAVFIGGTILDGADLDGTLLAPLAIVFAIKADALTPYLAWRFASDFPHVPDSRRSLRGLALARAASLALSVALIVASLLASPVGRDRGVIAFFAHSGTHSLYSQLQYVLVLAAFVTLAVRARRASPDERRRVSLLIGGLLVGSIPTIVWIILWTLIPRFGDAMPLRYAGWIIYPALLSIPAIAAYAVIAQRAFGVALLFRRAVEHALSRYSVLLLLSAPAIALVLDLYRHRDERLADALSPRTGSVALLLLAITVIGIRSYRSLLARIDRAFFRERFDARHVIAQLVDDCRWVGTRDELAALLSDGLDEALHVEQVHLYLLSQEHDRFDVATGGGRSLPTRTSLAALVSGVEEVFEFDASESTSRALSSADISWLVDTRLRCLVPLHDAASRLLGFLALGPKRSQLPFSRDDRALLTSVARAAELTLAYHGLFQSSANPGDTAVPAETLTYECVSCGLVTPDTAERCTACTGRLVECLLPSVVGGNLKLVARVGSGGMGTVYRALDMDLGRTVALKTLPFASPDAATRLRREAHIMATVAHEAVASVYAVHSWHGKPIIVYEFLGEGTLADRILRAPLPALEVIALGVTIADGLSAIHDAGLLHGDIKPSNIGFASSGRPKLLDFGIASRVQTLGERPAHPSQAGTLAYLAPEVARGGAPTFDADVWGLTMTLYEALTGRQPMIGGDFAETIDNVRAGRVPSAADYLPDVAPELDRFFAGAFSRDGRRRVSTAAALRSALVRMQEVVTTAT